MIGLELLSTLSYLVKNKLSLHLNPKRIITKATGKKRRNVTEYEGKMLISDVEKGNLFHWYPQF